MKASELTKAKYYLDEVLRDDETYEGGISYDGETLRDFLETADCEIELGVDDIGDIEMSDVNPMLIHCGIKPIDYTLKRERETFIAMLGVYYGENEHHSDSLNRITQLVNFARSYDFEMCEEDGYWVIDTELAREAAYEFARSLS